MDCNFFPGDVTHSLRGLSCTFQAAEAYLRQFTSYSVFIFPVPRATCHCGSQRIRRRLDSLHTGSLYRSSCDQHQAAVWPLFKLSRAFVWCMDRERKTLMEQSTCLDLFSKLKPSKSPDEWGAFVVDPTTDPDRISV